MREGKKLEVNGISIFVADSGESALPNVLCLHSLWFDHSMFDRLAVDCKGKYRVIRPDFRGQGQSASENEGCITMEACALDIIALAEKLDLRDIHIVGQSMGGDVAWRLVERRPDIVRSLTVLGASACAEPPDQLEWVREWLTKCEKNGIQGETLEFLMAAMFAKSVQSDPNKQPMLNYWRNFMAAVGRDGLPAMRGVVERKSVVDVLPSITTPTLVFSGAEDLVRPPSWSEEVVNNLSNANLIRLNGCGHSPMLEAPELVIPILSAHIDYIEAGACKKNTSE